MEDGSERTGDGTCDVYYVKTDDSAGRNGVVDDFGHDSDRNLRAVVMIRRAVKSLTQGQRGRVFKN